MSTNTSSADYGRFEVLAEEFAARFRRGDICRMRETLKFLYFVARCISRTLRSGSNARIW
jgi:hypothetical protein